MIDFVRLKYSLHISNTVRTQRHCWFPKDMSVYQICQYIEFNHLSCNDMLIHWYLNIMYLDL
jgi:hypothetical protein